MDNAKTSTELTKASAIAIPESNRWDRVWIKFISARGFILSKPSPWSKLGKILAWRVSEAVSMLLDSVLATCAPLGIIDGHGSTIDMQV